MACHGVISARRVNAGIACFTKLEITPPSFSNHSRYSTTPSLRQPIPGAILILIVARFSP
jgi:hypothetical protein